MVSDEIRAQSLLRGRGGGSQRRRMRRKKSRRGSGAGLLNRVEWLPSNVEKGAV